MGESTPKIEPQDEKSDKYEIYTTILIGLATVLGALSAYYASLCGGNSQSQYTLAVKQQSQANTAYLEVLSDYTQFEMDQFKDDIFYSEWKNNKEKGDPDAEYFFGEMTPGLQKDLTENPDNMTNYNKQEDAKLKELEKRFDETEAAGDSAEIILKQGQQSNSDGDKFTLATVLATVVLFFGGLASLKTKKHIKTAYLAMATVIFIIAVIRVLTTPFPG